MKIRFQTIEDIIKIFLFLIFFLFLFVFVFLSIAKIELIATAKGKIKAKKWYEVTSEVSGFIKEVSVKEGDRVKKGDLLMVVENEENGMEIKITRLEIERLYLEKESLERELKIMRRSFQNKIKETEISLSLSLTRLEKVRKGAKKEEVELALDMVNKANIELMEAKRKYEKKSEEYKEKLISRSELEEAEFEIKKAEANLSISQKELFLIKNKYTSEDYIIAKAEVEKEKTQLREIKNEQLLKEENLKNEILKTEKEIKKKEARLLFLEKSFKKLKIYSPATGTILTRNPKQLIGKFIESGDIVLKIGEPGEYIVEAEVNEVKRPKVKEGQRAKIFVKAFPWGEYGIFNGKVISISQDTVNNGFYEVSIAIFDPWVVIKGKRYFLKSGYGVEANIILEKDRIIKILLKELKKIKGEILPKNIYFKEK